MNPQAYVPAVGPIPLPAPYWVFKVLLVLTFVLHIIAMNFMLGSGVLALVARFRSAGHEHFRRLYHDLVKKLPVLLPATITLGVAPLLFVQVLYGRFFYTSSILIGWPWFSVLILLTLAYYGFYYSAFKADRNVGAVKWVLPLSMVFVVIIGFIFSNNLTLASTPGTWSGKYFADPSGMHLNLGEPTLIPRYLHFFTAALALGGLFVAGIGLFRWRRETDYARFLIEVGIKWFMYVTMAQFAIGIWFLASQPREIMLLFMGGSPLATGALIVGVVGGLASVFLASNTVRAEDPRRGVYAIYGVMTAVIVAMSLMRELLRDAYLAPYFNPAQFTVRTQWSVLPLFLVLFVVGVVLWGVMLRRYFSASRSSAE